MKYDKCKIEGCNGVGRLDNSGSRYFLYGFCAKHYWRYKQYGDKMNPEQRISENRVKNPLYTLYLNMKNRCYSIKNNMYPLYGGRGISVADRWLGSDGFTNFITDMGGRPSKNHSIDRIDNNGNYDPINCRWATIHQQSANKSSNNDTVGVSFEEDRKKWIAYLKVNGVYVLKKRFNIKEDAIKCRKEYEIKYNIEI